MRTITLKELYGKEHLQDLLISKDHEPIPTGYAVKLICNELVEGRLLKYHDETITVSYQDWHLHEPFRLRIKHLEPMIKVQFEIEGNSCFESLKQENINIPSNHFQFINIPKANGHITYDCSRKVLDIHIQPSYLYELLKTQGYSEKHIKEHFLLKNYTFYRRATLINEQQKRLIHDLLHHGYQSDFAQQYIRIKAIEIILTVFSGAHNSISNSKWTQSDIDIMMELKRYLDSNFQKELHLKTLTRQFGINEFKLKNAFKDLFADTVFGYIRKQKLKKAHHLLTHSEMEIKEIAYLSGFKYPHHFSKVYFEHYQILPSDFRNQYLAEQ